MDFSLHQSNLTATLTQDSLSRDSEASGCFSNILVPYLERHFNALGVAVFLVTCLGSCKQPGAIAMDSPYKARLRFSGLTVEDVDQIIGLMEAYVASSNGMLPFQSINRCLQKYLTAVSPKLKST
jgi:predicted metal-binding protein